MKAILVYSTKENKLNTVLEREFKSNLKRSGKLSIFGKKYKYTPSVDYVNHVLKHKLK